MVNFDDARESFNSKYIVNELTNCWNWTGALNKTGYGQFAVKQVDGSYKTTGAHRFSYVLHNGKIPEDKVIIHKCDNNKCVNPQHLVVGSHLENMLDLSRKIKVEQEQFEKDIKWIQETTGIITKQKAIRFGIRMLCDTITTEQLSN